MYHESPWSNFKKSLTGTDECIERLNNDIPSQAEREIQFLMN
jgi:hypothetical protein